VSRILLLRHVVSNIIFPALCSQLDLSCTLSGGYATVDGTMHTTMYVCKPANTHLRNVGT
jgi:hypothetical protein